MVWMSPVRWTQGKVSELSEFAVSSFARKLLNSHHSFHWPEPWHCAFRVPAKGWSTFLTSESLRLLRILRKIPNGVAYTALNIYPLVCSCTFSPQPDNWANKQSMCSLIPETPQTSFCSKSFLHFITKLKIFQGISQTVPFPLRHFPFIAWSNKTTQHCG